jgi:hypothetical protein
MEVPLETSVLALAHFGAVALGDVRRGRRLAALAEQMLKHPGGSLPQKLPQRADLVAFYRLMDRPEVTHRAVIAPHLLHTRQAIAAAAGVVLLIHDDTELDYTSHETLHEQLGTIGNGSHRGYICHNSLAVSEDRTVLGLAEQILHRRRKVPRHESLAAKRQHPQRESRLWLAGCESTNDLVDAATGLIVDIADRAADSFEFLEYEHTHRRHYVIRVARNRQLAGEDHVGDDRIYQKLFELCGDLPSLGEKSVAVASSTRKNAKARTARVRLAGDRVTLQRPSQCRGQVSLQSIETFVIDVREIDPPPGTQPLHWMLLSNQPLSTQPLSNQPLSTQPLSDPEALRRSVERCVERCVDWYECRPIIEDYHKGQKTGCGIELPQMEDVSRLEPTIAVLSVVAVVLLGLRQMGRDPRHADQPATRIVPQRWVQLLSLNRYGQIRELSIRDFSLLLAGLGGHQNRKHDGPPGWLTLWRGWTAFHLMLKGACLAWGEKCV